MSDSNPALLTLIVLLHAADGDRQRLRRFEQRVVPLIHAHGGRFDLVAAVEPAGDNGDEDDARRPDEVHVLTFPDEAAFAAWRADPRVTALAADRELAISQTTVWPARRLDPAADPATSDGFWPTAGPSR